MCACAAVDDGHDCRPGRGPGDGNPSATMSKEGSARDGTDPGGESGGRGLLSHDRDRPSFRRSLAPRRPESSTGRNQTISLDAALRAHTVDAARTLHRDHEIGSIGVGNSPTSWSCHSIRPQRIRCG